MSQLFNAEAQPEFDDHREASLQKPDIGVAASAEVQLAMRKFWDVVRSSAETIVTLRQEVAQLKAQQAAVVEIDSPATLARLDELQGALADAQEMNQMLEADVANSMRRISELETALEDGRVTQLQMRADVTEVIHTLESDIATSAQLRAQLEQELAGMSLRVAELEARLDEKAEQLADATEMAVKFEIIEREKQELEQRIERLQQRMVDLESLVDEKSARNEALAEDLSSAKREVAAFELQISAKDAEMQQLQRSASELMEQLQALEQEVSAPAVTDAGAEVRKLTDEISELQRQLDRAMGIVETYRAAGLRHIEDPSQRNQISLFGFFDAQPAAPSEVLREATPDVTAVAIPAGQTLLSDEELLGMADRLDDLAARVEELLRIS
ncbi:MAG: hypothetical protein FGM32_10415 [Candidatus Kapabacteria bacterium]|nr:hypothetical protein [Candidatus Kapabacteria bacterium]